MNYEELFVGGLSLVIAVGAIAVSVGPWDQPYRLRSVAALRQRHGKAAARCFWALIALACLGAGVSILAGIRPAYAIPNARAIPEAR